MAIPNAKLIARLPVQNRLGEGVLYHRETDSVYWTDIKGKRLYRHSLADNDTEYFTPPNAISAFGFTDVPGCLVVAFVHALALYWPQSGDVHLLHVGEMERPGNRFNDGKVGPDGNFWIGSMAENTLTNPSASLYRLDQQGRLTKAFGGVYISNGLCWSPDGKQMYHADSPLGLIRQYRFAAMPEQGQSFVQTESGSSPDGSCVDSQGRVWNAQWGGSRVVCYSSSGKELGQLPMPVSQPTCVALGGKEGNLLFVTSAWDELSEEQRLQQPYAGDLFIYKVDAKGLDEPVYCAEGLVRKGLP
ncbi:SMP-30/gluconolactonase/LRE family protein [Bowmanella dokdonensis]|uniref:SMP-30/gluconolactonase/LRE family protein n=1 Tax=Bowmanella dokdonensis TaxID=751969 RepID=A0A939DSI2_9ALTE|nr:SMP-30/gluconolactonase/LRE family protein [Bowmanella dokdonensis]MBN7827136.1 SMP-30/gluconolactonase/LRE family protein [Bowmanella dokdonensis]